MTDEAANYILNVDFLMAVIMLSIVSALLTVYAVRYYVRLRIKDYSMLTFAGASEKEAPANRGGRIRAWMALVGVGRTSVWKSYLL